MIIYFLVALVIFLFLLGGICCYRIFSKYPIFSIIGIILCLVSCIWCILLILGIIDTCILFCSYEQVAMTKQNYYIAATGGLLSTTFSYISLLLSTNFSIIRVKLIIIISIIIDALILNGMWNIFPFLNISFEMYVIIFSILILILYFIFKKEKKF